MSDLVALLRFLIQLSLQILRHFIITILRLLQVESYLVDVSERVQVFVLIHRHFIILVCVYLLLVADLLDLLL